VNARISFPVSHTGAQLHHTQSAHQNMSLSNNPLVQLDINTVLPCVLLDVFTLLATALHHMDRNGEGVW
jgi:hypothetical protein